MYFRSWPLWQVYILKQILSCFDTKKTARRRPESREETPKEANAASLLHCNNDLGTSLVQRKRRTKCLPLFFAKLRDVGASLSTAPYHRPPHSSLPRRTNADWLGSSTLSPADPILQPEECRKPHGTRGTRGSYLRDISMIRDVSIPWGSTRN